jgi:hypothetical protein
MWSPKLTPHIKRGELAQQAASCLRLVAVEGQLHCLMSTYLALLAQAWLLEDCDDVMPTSA